MTNQEIQNGLVQLGFNTGWVATGDQITIWENVEPQPTDKEILAAAVLYQDLLNAAAEANATAKAELLARLGITADEAKLLLG
jgi:MOSC domain-containing protein YiiM